MRKSVNLVTGLCLLLLTACATASQSPVTTQTAPPVRRETAASISSPSPVCETHTASVTLSASHMTVNVGDTFKVTVTLNNEGCLALGVPQYVLYASTTGSPVTATNPKPIVHYLAVDPGQSDSAEFTLQTVAPGSVEFTASASFEVHLGYPGPAYWGNSTSREPLRVLVRSNATEMPMAESGFTSLRIPEVPLTISFPSAYTLTRSLETNRRGSFVSYDFGPLQALRGKTPYLKEIQFFSTESIEEFTKGCTGSDPCFFGDYPDLERYYGQLKAYRDRRDFQTYKLVLLVERFYFASTHPCEGDTCVIREYTAFVPGDIKVDIWIIMEDETEITQSDEIMRSVKLQE